MEGVRVSKVCVQVVCNHPLKRSSSMLHDCGSEPRRQQLDVCVTGQEADCNRQRATGSELWDKQPLAAHSCCIKYVLF